MLGTRGADSVPALTADPWGAGADRVSCLIVRHAPNETKVRTAHRLTNLGIQFPLLFNSGNGSHPGTSFAPARHTSSYHALHGGGAGNRILKGNSKNLLPVAALPHKGSISQPKFIRSRPTVSHRVRPFRAELGHDDGTTICPMMFGMASMRASMSFAVMSQKILFVQDATR